MGEIKVTLENWLGQVHFEVSEEKVKEFNEYWEDMGMDEDERLSEENNFTLRTSSFCSDPYVMFEPDGEFVLMTRNYVSNGDAEAIGFEIEFENCKVPDELNKHLYDGCWLFIDQGTRKIITDTKISEKLSKARREGDVYVDNNGDGVIRFKDFDWKKFINQYL